MDRSAYNKAYYQANKEIAKANRRAYYQANKEYEKARNKSWIEDNKERRKAYKKSYREANKESIKIYQDIYNKFYRELNKNNRNIYNKTRQKNDIQFKLACNLRKRLIKAIKINQKAGSAIKDLGCSVEFLKQHLESKFQPGMTWENYGKTGWHIDHIKPLSSFDLTNKEQFLKACHYTNLQPLWSIDNIKKGNKHV